jgi:hypothetical protein
MEGFETMVDNRLKSEEKRASQPIIIDTHQQNYRYDEKYYTDFNQNVHSPKYPFNADLFRLMSFSWGGA